MTASYALAVAVEYVLRRRLLGIGGDNLLGAAATGLLYAAQRFDPARGPFAVVAGWVIAQRVDAHAAWLREGLGPCDGHPSAPGRGGAGARPGSIPRRRPRMIRRRWTSGRTSGPVWRPG